MTQNGASAGGKTLKRFYAEAATAQVDDLWRVLIDGKPVRTPNRAYLATASKPLADALAAEWASQGEYVVPAQMHLNRLVNTAIDGIVGREELVIDNIVAYAASDLVLYRAKEPPDLRALQDNAWDPPLAWAANRGARYQPTTGVIHVKQTHASVQAMKEFIKQYNALQLTALHSITTLTGSGILAAAFADGAMSEAEVWAAAHVDEDWQVSKWGQDAEAAARRDRRRDEMGAAAKLFRLSAA
jgi:chaperone required for assembly of F1-ATPase